MKKYLLSHNEQLYSELEKTIAEKGKVLVVLGTGLGKTTTALEYLSQHNCRGLVVVPSNVIKNAWERYSEVDIITYQMFSTTYEEIDYSKYGVVIYDEVHHSGADTWGNSLRYLLENKIIQVIGLTATPLRSDGIHIGDELFEGAVVKGLDILEAVKKGILHKFSYISAYYDAPKTVEDVLQKYTDTSEKLIGQLDLALNNTPNVKKILQEEMPSGKRKGVIFCYRIEDMGEAENLIHEAYPEIEIRRLHSNMGDNDIEENRNWFENTDEGYLLTVYMLGEGAHYNGVNTVIMLRKTESNLVFQQQLGRCLTLTCDKNGNAVENPHAIVFDLVNNSKNVKNTLKAIKEAVQDLGELEVRRRIREAQQSENKTPYTDQLVVKSYTEELDEVFERIKAENSDNWTQEEDEIIKKYYQEIGAKGCAELLPKRNIDTIQARATLYGLRSSLCPRFREWSKEEDDILRQFYREEGIDIVSRFTNRTWENIRSRASALKIKGKRWVVWSKEEIEILQKYGNSEGIKVRDRLPLKKEHNIERKAKELNITLKDCSLRKKVRCVETGQIWQSMSAAIRDMKCKSIDPCLRKKCKTAGGYHWEYVEEDNE